MKVIDELKHAKDVVMRKKGLNKFLFCVNEADLSNPNWNESTFKEVDVLDVLNDAISEIERLNALIEKGSKLLDRGDIVHAVPFHLIDVALYLIELRAEVNGK